MVFWFPAIALPRLLCGSCSKHGLALSGVSCAGYLRRDWWNRDQRRPHLRIWSADIPPRHLFQFWSLCDWVPSHHKCCLRHSGPHPSSPAPFPKPPVVARWAQPAGPLPLSFWLLSLLAQILNHLDWWGPWQPMHPNLLLGPEGFLFSPCFCTPVLS